MVKYAIRAVVVLYFSASKEDSSENSGTCHLLIEEI